MLARLANGPPSPGVVGADCPFVSAFEAVVELVVVVVDFFFSAEAEELVLFCEFREVTGDTARETAGETDSVLLFDFDDFVLVAVEVLGGGTFPVTGEEGFGE